MKKFFNIRRDYSNQSLNFNDLNADPLIQFDSWFRAAQKIEPHEPNAFVLGTSTKTGRNSSRFLLLKAYDDEGFIFFTNYESRKSKQIAENPYGAMAFYWPVLQRQVRIEGKITNLPKKQSDEYFHVRPDGSKIGAWASPQSEPIPNREYLEKLKKEYEDKYSQFRIPRPEYWGGYKLVPDLIEFWQGRADRLHDRFEYRLLDGVWIKERLAP
ncbi:MAG TPA: pyridoxamine 5'-phosphate oxidase [Bacteroidales bacterium]|jgi:pyridoxamine 5'-phosphate oxidase|nr:pyridoxamine 5'-phosphate oxidase [Bacteroidales bacterium]